MESYLCNISPDQQASRADFRARCKAPDFIAMAQEVRP